MVIQGNSVSEKPVKCYYSRVTVTVLALRSLLLCYVCSAREGDTCGSKIVSSEGLKDLVQN